MDQKHCQLQIKSIDDDEQGSFEGLLSVYGIRDQGNDVVEVGAFAKTLQENRGRVPLLWAHQATEPIGSIQLRDTPKALEVKGKLLLTIQRARDAYELIKSHIVSGLSIGYQPIPSRTKVKDGVRHIHELKLYEGSLVVFPMLDEARISSVKAQSFDVDSFVAQYRMKLEKVLGRRLNR